MRYIPKITNVTLEERSSRSDITLDSESVNFIFIFNERHFNFTVVGEFYNFEIQFVNKQEIDFYYPEYYNNFLEVIKYIPDNVFDALDHLLENSNNYYGRDIKEDAEHFIYVSMLNLCEDLSNINLKNGKKEGNIVLNIGDYLKYKESERLKLLLKDNGKNNTKKLKI